MSTQTAALPDGTKLTKPASGEKVSLSVINTNTDNIANNIIALNPKKNNITSLTDDTTILNLAAGVYQIALVSSSSYIPERWGTLLVDRSGSTYGCVTFNSTSGKTYTRHMNGVASWHDGWQQLVINSQLAEKMPTTLKLERQSANTTSFNFSVQRTSSSSYSYFLLVGGISISQGFVYHGFVHVGGNDKVGLMLIGGTAVPGIAGTYDGTTLTITATETVYGGMRIIWLS